MKKIILFLISILLFSCNNNNDDDNPIEIPSCNENAQIIEETNFNDLETNNYFIQNVVLNDYCLSVTVSSSGCSPDNWNMNLFSHNNFTFVYPATRFAKIELINNEACLAVFQKTISFDLTPYQIQGQNQVQINLQGWNEQILYTY